MAAEIDTAVDDGNSGLSLVEAKAHTDFSLRRNEAFVFSCKVRDHEISAAFRWRRVHALMASAGRVDAIFCRWCFYEGIDVLDPDRLPLVVLARLPYVLSRDEFALLQDHHRYDWLRDILQVSRDELVTGPVLLRDPTRRRKLIGTVLHDLNDIQANLSESVWAAVGAAMCGKAATEEQWNAVFLERVWREFRNIGVTPNLETPTRVIDLRAAAR